MKRSVFALALALAVSTGCATAQIPHTDLDDTEENRNIVTFVETYKKAIEEQAVDKTLALVADDFFEDNATLSNDDDYDKNGLAERLKAAAGHVDRVLLDIHVHKVTHDDGLVRVDYRYQQRTLLILDAGKKWVTKRDVNQLVLRPSDNDAGFVIVGGI